MSEPSICPATRDKCDHVLVCWLAFCAVLRMRGGVRHRPISERDLTKAERYALHMRTQKAVPQTGPVNPGTASNTDPHPNTVAVAPGEAGRG